MKTIFALPLTLALASMATAPLKADPLLSSWITAYSAKYARVYYVSNSTTGATSGPASTWSNSQLSQTLPAYCGVQQIDYSDAYTYFHSTGLGSHTMGPWYNDATRTTAFVNLPVNQHDIFRIPRVPAVPTTKSNIQGEFGFFVDGVHGFDSTDATSYSHASGKDGDPPGTPNGLTGDGVWNRDAYMTEAVTFDGALAHQQNTGVYHYHANPIAPRYLLGDHVTYNSATNVFTESTAAPDHHSPIVGWAKDGYPIYGPYGYSTATSSTSGVRRMVCGYVPRNGSNGTTNLATAGRHTIPAWAVRVQGGTTTLASTKYGPDVSTSFPLGRYIEDNDYLGDLGKTLGVDFDLDEHNGRYCVTPEYPNGTYAYFVALTAAGLPTFPYNLGRQYYGSPTGGVVTSVTETVTNYFKGGPDTREAARMDGVAANSGNVIVSWSSVEGGTYKVEASPDVSSWSALTTAQAATSGDVRTSYVETGAATTAARRFYRITRTALASYDSVTTTGGTGTGSTSGISSVSPTSGSRGATVVTTITLNSAYNPAPPPATVSPTSANLTRTGATTIGASSYSRDSSTGVVTATFAIPANATAGAYTVNATFGPNTWSLTNGFTVN